MIKFFQIVRDLNLPKGDFAIFGSGPLIIRGLIPGSNDLDIICRGAAWEAAKAIGRTQYVPEYNVEIATMCDDAITFGNQWGIGNPNIDRLIDDAEIIDELPFVSLRHVVKYKLLRASPKDMRHIKILKDNGFEKLVVNEDEPSRT